MHINFAQQKGSAPVFSLNATACLLLLTGQFIVSTSARVGFGSCDVNAVIRTYLRGSVRIASTLTADNKMDACFEERLCEEIRHYPHYPVRLPFDYLDSRSSDRLPTWRPYCWGWKEEALSPVSLAVTWVYFPYCRFLLLCITWCNAPLSFVEGKRRSTCLDAADVPDENAAEALTFRNEIAILIRLIAQPFFWPPCTLALRPDCVDPLRCKFPAPKQC